MLRSKRREVNTESEVSPGTKIRVVATVEERIVSEMRMIHDEETKLAQRGDRVEPDWSNTVEMLLRKGIKTWRNERKKTDPNS
jgi:hypothetical protein